MARRSLKVTVADGGSRAAVRARGGWPLPLQSVPSDVLAMSR